MTDSEYAKMLMDLDDPADAYKVEEPANEKQERMLDTRLRELQWME